MTGLTNDDDARLVAALRAGDEGAFRAVVGRYNDTLLRLATLYVNNPAVAAEVVQETWIGVFRGAEHFEERSSLKTWICRILVNQAKSAARREGRSIPFAELDDQTEPFASVDPLRFRDRGQNRGGWSRPPQPWDLPADRLLSKETLAVVSRAIDALPASQRITITMRDVEGMTAAEACAALGISEVHQRVLLHRARARVRAELEAYFSNTSGPA
jgi:RNA polymerase sigma-70 factor (ECF subfamily)